jgi:predicted RNA-binding Zn ribbon-like protein
LGFCGYRFFVQSVDALFLAGHPGLDFLNTKFVEPGTGTTLEAIGDGSAFVVWIRQAGLLDVLRGAGDAAPRLRFSEKALDAAAAEARTFRQWASDWVERWCRDPTGDYRAEVERLNRLLERTAYHRQVAARSGSLTLLERCRIGSAGDLMTLVALQIALLVAHEQPELVKRCQGAECVLWFVDRTKAHRRRFCSAAVCGNRAKVAAFRERQRDGS